MPRKKVSVEPVEKIWLSTKEFAKYIGMSTGYILLEVLLGLLLLIEEVLVDLRKLG